MSYKQSANKTQASLATLNRVSAEEFVAILSELFEHSPWIAAAVVDRRPFDSVTALHTAMASVVMAASLEQRLLLLNAHPELARRVPLTAASQTEQATLGLDRLDDSELARFESTNARYRKRFGFPFIIAVKAQRNRRAILTAMEHREKNDSATEMIIALNEVAAIARFRLDSLIVSGKEPKLTLHVLDTSRGRPASGLSFTLYRLTGEIRDQVAAGETNEDGRASQGPLLNSDDLQSGLYELVFEAGSYMVARGDTDDPLFFDVIPIRFRINDPNASYHVPLILSRYGYSTYRGS